MKPGSLNFLEHSGPLQTCNRDCSTFADVTEYSQNNLFSLCLLVSGFWYQQETSTVGLNSTWARWVEFLPAGRMRVMWFSCHLSALSSPIALIVRRYVGYEAVRCANRSYLIPWTWTSVGKVDREMHTHTALEGARWRVSWCCIHKYFLEKSNRLKGQI